MIDVVPDMTQSRAIVFVRDGERTRAVIAWIIDVDEGDARGTTVSAVTIEGCPSVYCVESLGDFGFPADGRVCTTLEEALDYGRQLLPRSREEASD